MHEGSSHTGPGYDFLSFVNREQLGVFATAIFERVGYFTTPGEGLAVHGIDFIVYKPDGSEPEIALRCRTDEDGKVEISDVARFWEKITGQGYERGIFVTNKTFSVAAFAYGEQRDLILVDQDGLKKGINALPVAHRSAVLKKVAAATESRPVMVEIDVPNLVLPRSATADRERDAAPSDAAREEAGLKVFRTPSAARSRDRGTYALEEVEETPLFGSPAPASSVKTEEAKEDDLRSWLGDEEKAWKALENSNRQVKSVTNLLAVLSPVMLCTAGFLLWEPLMGKSESRNEAIVAPLVSEYLQAKESGDTFDVVAKLTNVPEDTDKTAN